MALVSDTHKFVFVHIPKNAGSSMSTALSQKGGRHLRQYDTHVPISIIYPEYQNYFTFAFVRNPWDRLWSMFNFTIKRGWISETTNFDKWIQSSWITKACEYQTPIKPITRKPQIDWISIDGNVVVDYIGRYETIDSDFEKICDAVGISVKLPHLNSTVSTNYRNAYSDFSYDFVLQNYKQDVEAFEYEF